MSIDERDEEYNVWIGKNRGLSLVSYNPNTKKARIDIRGITEHEDLNLAKINDIEIDSQHIIWVASDRGVFKYLPLKYDREPGPGIFDPSMPDDDNGCFIRIIDK